MKLKEKQLSFLCGSISILAFLVLWFFATNGTMLGEMIPGPHRVIVSLLKSFVVPIGRHVLLSHTFYSLARVMVGFVIASACGVVVGLLMGWSRVLEAILQPLFRIIRPIPPIAWIPISIILFGLGESAKYFLIFLAAFSNVTLNAYAGAVAVDPRLIGAAQTLGANKRQIFMTIVMPASVPQIFAGLQIAMSSSWATVLAAEMVRSSEGLGWIIVSGMNNNDMLQILTGIVAIGLVGFALAVIMRKLEDILCRWNKSGE